MRSIVLCLTVLIIAGCGSDSGPDSDVSTATERASHATTTTTTTTTTSEPTTAAASDTAAAKADLRAAVRAVREELPDIPLWQGTRFKATAVSDTEVCVDRIIKKSSADALGGRRTSHVMVSMPDGTTAEPEEGACARRRETASRQASARQRFYLKIDDDALALDDAVNAAQDGEAGAASRIASLRKRILDRVNDHLLDGGDTSVGANLLLSAATTARDAARAGDVERLSDVRRGITDARSKLADELAS
jgi:hypothetical protein